MLFIGIPAYNEATTIGVLLWRLRSVLSDVSREYEVVVYDDASTDETTAVLEPYTRVLPLTLLRGARRLGTGGAIDAIVRHVSRSTRYPRRDGLLLMQADFTDPPALVPEFLRRFEGGADLIIGERTSAGEAPQPVRRLFAASRWVLRPFVGISEVRDLTSSFRLARITVLRDLLKASGEASVSSGDAWMAQADFLLRAAPFARRVETIPVTPTFGLRTRETRRTAWPDALALTKWGWRHRGLRVAAKVIARSVDAPVEVADPVDTPETERPDRRERSPEPADKRGRRERGGERRERGAPRGGERKNGRAEAPLERSERTKGRAEPRDRDERDNGSNEGRDPAPRPPRARRAITAPTHGEADAETPAVPAELTGSPIEPAEGDRGPRKRRRNKRGAKRAGERAGLPSGHPDAALETLDLWGQPNEPELDTTRGDAPAAPSPDEEREPKRRRPRRGRRKRSDGSGASDGSGEDRGDQSRTVGGAGQDGEAGRTDGGEGQNGDAGRGSEASTDPTHPDGEGGAKRRNRRGRRGGRRRSGSSSGGEPGAPDGSGAGETGASDHPAGD